MQPCAFTNIETDMGKTNIDKLREVYDRMDKNEDGTLSYHELKTCIMESQSCSDDEADGILHVSRDRYLDE